MSHGKPQEDLRQTVKQSRNTEPLPQRKGFLLQRPDCTSTRHNGDKNVTENRNVTETRQKRDKRQGMGQLQYR
eukprot:9500662-Pyramimonas_sp.AAC.1